MRIDDDQIRSLATRALTWFTMKKRTSGEEYLTIKEKRPAWVHDLVMEAHGDLLPDDQRYTMIREVLQGLAEDGEDATFEPDIYNAALTAWLSSNLNRIAYVDQAGEEIDYPRTAGLVERLQAGQLVELDEIKGLILGFFSTVEISKK